MTAGHRREVLKITFEFIGGPYDGMVLSGKLGEPSDAERYYLFSNHGALGQQFKVVSEYAIETLAKERLKAEELHVFQPHFYVVAGRIEDGGEVWVSAAYAPGAVETDRSAP